ncbi:hypothetical protein [Hyalangium rubrum]|uniref:Uncharacterized protein n=1 Tax=Hyalangium rubrum TaxID=3103134 RepID=A0ABU5HGE6_9BACT|nr:hypothetical protein [Hyalangium sp. s54d21]MDY7231160.1 hypothetical protein [Hyalangium sp. s54d21]
MKLAHEFRQASGPSAWDCHFLADRWEGPGWVEDHAESWVGQVVNGQVFTLLGQVGWLTGLWRSPSGSVYVAEGSHLRGGMHINRAEDPLHPDWKFHALPFLAMGVWGLDDQFVLAWGPKVGQRESALFCWDGKRWQEWDSPGEIIAMHGLARDFIYAVGRNGLIAWWNGGKWNTVPSFTQAVLTGIHAVSEDEVYACGDNGVMEGSVYGWSEVVESPGMVTDVAKYAGTVWLAGEEDGLLRLQGPTLEEADASLRASAFDVRERLLVTSPECLADSQDGKKFRRLPLEGFISRLSDRPPLW